MNFRKQVIYIARRTKELHLEVELFNLQKLSLKDEFCEYFEVYKSDDCKEEFLVYEEWKSEDSYKESLKKKPYLSFMTKYDELVLKKESLPII